jgi:hypothetical protein
MTPPAVAQEESAPMHEQSLTARTRDTGWKKDGKA